MKSLFTFVLIALAFGSVSGQTIFDQFEGNKWTGTGTLMGSPATFTMVWSQELDGAFYHLSFENRRKGQEASDIVFKAEAYYRMGEDSSVVGSWFDSRGITLPLTGEATKEELTILWGSPETEQGKTVYTLKSDDTVQVTDYILRGEEYLKFGEATYVLE